MFHGQRETTPSRLRLSFTTWIGSANKRVLMSARLDRLILTRLYSPWGKQNLMLPSLLEAAWGPKGL